jgi:hypothetical protein
MTSTVSREVGEGTQNLTYVLNPPALRRPDASGEFPIIQPGGPVGPNADHTFRLADDETLIRPVGVEELARLSANETLVLPVDAVPHTPRHAAPTVYPQPEEERPWRYRGKRREADPPWAWALIGAGALAVGECIGLALMAAFR